MTDSVATDMRAGLRRLAKAVIVATTKVDGTRYAMAATAVTEMSLDPPSILICVNQNASIHQPLSRATHFCLNILNDTQRDVAERCGGKATGEARFEGNDWRDDAEAPYLADSQAAFICKRAMSFSFGTHTAYVGEVVGVKLSGDAAPLVYVDGRYVRVGEDC